MSIEYIIKQWCKPDYLCFSEEDLPNVTKVLKEKRMNFLFTVYNHFGEEVLFRLFSVHNTELLEKTLDTAPKLFLTAVPTKEFKSVYDRVARDNIAIFNVNKFIENAKKLNINNNDKLILFDDNKGSSIVTYQKNSQPHKYENSFSGKSSTIHIALCKDTKWYHIRISNDSNNLRYLFTKTIDGIDTAFTNTLNFHKNKNGIIIEEETKPPAATPPAATPPAATSGWSFTSGIKPTLPAEFSFTSGIKPTLPAATPPAATPPAATPPAATSGWSFTSGIKPTLPAEFSFTSGIKPTLPAATPPAGFSARKNKYYKTDTYESKYLKYKQKYLQLKQILSLE